MNKRNPSPVVSSGRGRLLYLALRTLVFPALAVAVLWRATLLVDQGPNSTAGMADDQKSSGANSGNDGRSILHARLAGAVSREPRSTASGAVPGGPAWHSLSPMEREFKNLVAEVRRRAGQGVRPRSYWRIAWDSLTGADTSMDKIGQAAFLDSDGADGFRTELASFLEDERQAAIHQSGASLPSLNGALLAYLDEHKRDGFSGADLATNLVRIGGARGSLADSADLAPTSGQPVVLMTGHPVTLSASLPLPAMSSSHASDALVSLSAGDSALLVRGPLPPAAIPSPSYPTYSPGGVISRGAVAIQGSFHLPATAPVNLPATPVLPAAKLVVHATSPALPSPTLVASVSNRVSVPPASATPAISTVVSGASLSPTSAASSQGASVIHQSAPDPVAMYVSGGPNGNIYQVTSSGVASVFATLPSGISGAAESEGLAFDPSGNLYVADLSNDQIDKVTPGGSVSVLVNLNNAGLPSAPEGLVYYGGSLYVTDFGGNRILKVTLAGAASVFAANVGMLPQGLAVDSSGNFYTPDLLDGRVIKVDSNGVPSVFGTAPNPGGLSGGIAVDANGVAYAGDTAGLGGLHTIDLFFNGNYEGSIHSLPANGLPVGLQFDSSGRLFVADTNNNDVLEFVSSGSVSSVFAPTSGSLAQANYLIMALPEPGSVGLLVVGVTVLLGRRRRSDGGTATVA